MRSGRLAAGVEALQDRALRGVAPPDLPADRLPLRRALAALGGARGALLATLPTIGFVVGTELSGLRAGVLAGAATVLLVLVERVRAGARPVAALAGSAAVVVLLLLTLATGRPEAFFLPGVLTQTAQCAGLLLTALVGRPVTGAVGQAFGALPARWREDRALVGLFVRQDLLWAAVFGARAVVTAALVLAGTTAWAGVFRLTGTPLFVLLVALCVRWARPAVAARRA
ncbi:MAG TPA: DUF3159 domain-containing protein [Mycobacteriales bacterium]|nr:DUF3159 domain-containing protein [Mycobacteriales bacterium]